jgi:hypothetical protein
MRSLGRGESVNVSASSAHDVLRANSANEQGVGESRLAWRSPPSPGMWTYFKPNFFKYRANEALLNCGLCAERGTVRTSTTQVGPCTRSRWINSSIVRVE